MFWISSFALDYIAFFVVAFTIFIVFAAFGITREYASATFTWLCFALRLLFCCLWTDFCEAVMPIFMHDMFCILSRFAEYSGSLGYIFLLLLLLGFALVPFIYLLSFIFSDSSAAFSRSVRAEH